MISQLLEPFSFFILGVFFYIVYGVRGGLLLLEYHSFFVNTLLFREYIIGFRMIFFFFLLQIIIVPNSRN